MPFAPGDGNRELKPPTKRGLKRRTKEEVICFPEERPKPRKVWRTDEHGNERQVEIDESEPDAIYRNSYYSMEGSRMVFTDWNEAMLAEFLFPKKVAPAAHRACTKFLVFLKSNYCFSAKDLGKFSDEAGVNISTLKNVILPKFTQLKIIGRERNAALKKNMYFFSPTVFVGLMRKFVDEIESYSVTAKQHKGGQK